MKVPRKENRNLKDLKATVLIYAEPIYTQTHTHTCTNGTIYTQTHVPMAQYIHTHVQMAQSLHDL